MRVCHDEATRRATRGPRQARPVCPAGGSGLVRSQADGPRGPAGAGAPAGFFLCCFGGEEASGEGDVGVFGATGYTGRELVRLLAAPPRAPASPSRPAPAAGTSPTRPASRARPTPTSSPCPTASPPRYAAQPARARPARGRRRPLRRPAPAHRRGLPGVVRARSSRARAARARRPYGLTEVYRERLPRRAAHLEPRLLRDLGAAAARAAPARAAGRAPTTSSWTRRAAPPAPGRVACARTCCSARSPTTSRPTRPAAPTGTWARWRPLLPKRRAAPVAPHLLPAPPAREARHPLGALREDRRVRLPSCARALAAFYAGSPLRAGGGRAPPRLSDVAGHERLPHLRARRRPGPRRSSSRPSTTS